MGEGKPEGPSLLPHSPTSVDCCLFQPDLILALNLTLIRFLFLEFSMAQKSPSLVQEVKTFWVRSRGTPRVKRSCRHSHWARLPRPLHTPAWAPKFPLEKAKSQNQGRFSQKQMFAVLGSRKNMRFGIRDLG